MRSVPKQNLSVRERRVNPLKCSGFRQLHLKVFNAIQVTYIFTARAYARAVLGVVILSLRPSVRLSVTRVDCDKTK